MLRMQDNAPVTKSILSSLEARHIVFQALVINSFIVFLAFIVPFFSWPALIGGLCIILYLSVNALSRPVNTFFLIFGVKLTFDAFWIIKVPSAWIGSVGMLDLFLVPIVITLMLGGPGPVRQSVQWLLWGAVVYVLWVCLALLFNGYGPDLELIIRQSGILMGLLLGLRFVKDKRDFDLLMYLVWISTVIPVLASILQIVVTQFDISVLYYKIGNVRNYRLSGLYYDPACTGMVNIISMVSNLYLLRTGTIRSKNRKYHLLFLPLNLVVVIVGGTRSMIAVAFIILVLSLPRNVKQAIQILVLGLLVVFLTKPYIDNVIARSVFENKRVVFRPMKLEDLLQETEYRTMFSGRVNIWQDVWQKFNEGSLPQRLFGSGLSSNAHSSYFFLLLEIGWLGLGFYVFLHLKMLLVVWGLRKTRIASSAVLISILSIVLVGISATVVIYTSFQWFCYLLIGSALNIKEDS